MPRRSPRLPLAYSLKPLVPTIASRICRNIWRLRMGDAQQGRELSDPNYVTLLIEDGAQLVAYAQLRQHPPPPCVDADAPVELYRFYVDRAWHGQGVAQQLMAGVHDAARAAQGGTLWLSVWEQNARAIAFYSKCGYRDVGSADFFVGPDRQTDRILVVEVADPAPVAT